MAKINKIRAIEYIAIIGIIVWVISQGNNLPSLNSSNNTAILSQNVLNNKTIIINLYKYNGSTFQIKGNISYYYEYGITNVTGKCTTSLQTFNSTGYLIVGVGTTSVPSYSNGQQISTCKLVLPQSINQITFSVNNNSTNTVNITKFYRILLAEPTNS